eukprot:scaffold50117_cov55-Phaeocystis_antarctica.AAC.2
MWPPGRYWAERVASIDGSSGGLHAHRRGALGRATRRGGVHPAGAFCAPPRWRMPPPGGHVDSCRS